MLRALSRAPPGCMCPRARCATSTNTSDALTSGGTFADCRAVQRMWTTCCQHTGEEPECIMTGGAGLEDGPSMSSRLELVEGLILTACFQIASNRFQRDAPATPDRPDPEAGPSGMRASLKS